MRSIIGKQKPQVSQDSQGPEEKDLNNVLEQSKYSGTSHIQPPLIQLLWLSKPQFNEINRFFAVH